MDLNLAVNNIAQSEELPPENRTNICRNNCISRNYI